MEYQAVAYAIESTVKNDSSKIRDRYVKFTDVERYEIRNTLLRMEAKQPSNASSPRILKRAQFGHSK